MSTHDADRSGPHVAAQAAAAWTAQEAAIRNVARSVALSNQEAAFRDAQDALRVVKDFVGAPEHILGSDLTKHGEIAEQVHVGVRRASDLLHQRVPEATFEGIGRLDAVDYVDGVAVQSKYYNGLSNTLDGIAAHMERYKEFATGAGRYHIPRDQFEQLRQLRETGTIDGLADRNAARLQRQIETLATKSGRTLDELIEPGEATYAEVQQGRVHDTIAQREDGLSDTNEDLKEQVHTDHGPTSAGALTAAPISAAAGAGVSFAQSVWGKCKKGKNPFHGEFSAEDWRDIGIETATGAGGGAVAGGALYLLTNATELSAPFAGALVSGMMGLGRLVRHYQSGQIDNSQFVNLSLLVASDAAIVGVASMAGQTLIPMPMLGAFVGSIAGKLVVSAIRDRFGGVDSDLAAQVEAYESQAVAKLDQALRDELKRLDSWFGNLAEWSRIAFDEATNSELRLAASVRIAETVGVPDHHILRSSSDTDTCMQA
jgi:hypothetical protein